MSNLDPTAFNKIPNHHNIHLASVLRMNVNDSLVVFNESCGEWLASIVSIDKKGIYVRCLENIRPAFEDEHKLRIAFGMIKHDNMKWMIEKITELGVTEIFPLITEYSNIKDMNCEKYNKIIIAAVEQSERISVPALHNPMSFNSFLNEHGEDGWCAALERTNSVYDRDAVANSGFIIGPEGGFSKEETEKLLTNPTITPISLSQNILRTETAAIACASISFIWRRSRK
ncbi:MAG: 16S rRNA (uracil(1498)-N(3))-methyltransferase [Holosporales bacterium]|jgi:16S rRNA (uracil1498-N3)-methyltransferase|nr:16S rRNA (uracil(1498)-N(3))-methyltransferase [Holosporales bacterium]